MTSPRTDDQIVEEFADMEHRRWAKWQEYLHSKCVENPDGSLTIPAHLVVRWKCQISTPYSQLTEAEKESDRKEVRPYIEHTTATLAAVREEERERILDLLSGYNGYSMDRTREAIRRPQSPNQDGDLST